MAVTAPPPKLMVWAVALSKSKDVLPVVMDVATAGEVIAGALLKTATPPALPVSSVKDAAKVLLVADVAILLDPSVKSARDAVSAERLIVASERTVLPVPLASSVKSPLAPVAIVNAPLSAMLFVVKV
jgi:hypothetical protein